MEDALEDHEGTVSIGGRAASIRVLEIILTPFQGTNGHPDKAASAFGV